MTAMEDENLTSIVEAKECAMPAVRQIFEDYQRWLGVDLCFQDFASELDSLPGRYAAPGGFILLAVEPGQPDDRLCGCVAVRPHRDGVAELKRLFVRPEHHGRGLGGRLFVAAMTRAGNSGYHSILLDTLPQMKTAQGMYLRYGFEETEPYTENPVEGVQFFKYSLR